MKVFLSLLAFVGLGYHRLALFDPCDTESASQATTACPPRNFTEKVPDLPTLRENGQTAPVIEEVIVPSMIPETEGTAVTTENTVVHSTLADSESTKDFTKDVSSLSTISGSEGNAAVTDRVHSLSTLSERESTAAGTKESLLHSTLEDSESTAVTRVVSTHPTLSEGKGTLAITEEVQTASTHLKTESTAAVADEVSALSTLPYTGSTAARTEKSPLITTTPSSDDAGLPSKDEMCVEDEVVADRAKTSVEKLWHLFKEYTRLMRTNKSCLVKYEIYKQISQKMPWLFRSMIAVFNAIYDKYENPFIKRNPELEQPDICKENNAVMKMARKEIRRLQKALDNHRNIMSTGSWTCLQKWKEIKRTTEARPKLYKALRAVYLAVSKYYRSPSEGVQIISIPTDHNDQPKYDAFEKMLKDLFLYTRVAPEEHR